jgi:hypothetical protein
MGGLADSDFDGRSVDLYGGSFVFAIQCAIYDVALTVQDFLNTRILPLRIS